MTLSWLLVLLLAVCQVRANVQAVFAHFMVSNTGLYTISDWEDDIAKAQAAHIDGFALNIAVNDSTNGDSLGNAFIAANNLGSTFKLFLSFDYAGNGLWPKQDVISLIEKYSSSTAYYHRGSQPLVSTFEGPAASADWTDIKLTTDCFFIPSWSSLSSTAAWALGTPDGLFSWGAWPSGPNSMDTFTDASYFDAVNGKPYMMPVSPWFYTNLPGYRKNWLWRGDTLWFDRWVSVMYLQPEYVEILTWNDYGESHYIGPLRDNAYIAFDVGNAPFNYALNKSHDAWRIFLPYLIDLAKTNITSFSEENLITWYRQNPHSACGTGGTTGNTASQLQQLYAPAELSEDKVFFTALLASSASVTVSIGGQSIEATWSDTPSNGVGLYHGSVPFGGLSGDVIVSIRRSSTQILQASGDPITTACTDSIENWNAYTMTSAGNSISSTSPLSLSEVGCTGGFGDPKYLELCAFACKYDYCPKGACTCTSLGPAIDKPVALGIHGCPAPGKDSTYLGLCSFSCNYGYCPEACATYPSSYTCTALDPVAPPVPVCISGMADGAYAELCGMACYYGFCPPQICTCTLAGTSIPALPAVTDMIGGPIGTEDYGVCQWTCLYGNCPSDLCSCIGSGCPTAAPTVATFSKLGELAITKNVAGELGQGCSRSNYCTDQTDPQDSSCHKGQVKLGWDKAGCKGDNKGVSICCDSGTTLTQNTCLWRGDVEDCNGQCHVGETTVLRSSWGGGPTQGNTKKCNRGVKVFCCEAPNYALASYGCRWTGCGGICNSNTEDEVTTRTDAGFCLSPKNRYCCPKPSLIYSCTWRGTFPDCADAKCEDDEVAVSLSTRGDTSNSCWWGRQKTDCCKLRAPPPPAPLRCDDDDAFCKLFPDLCILEENDAFGSSKRDVESDDDFYTLMKRGKPNPYPASDKSLGLKPFLSFGYPSRAAFIKTATKRGMKLLWFGVSALCGNTDIIKNDGLKVPPPAKLDTEHPIDQQVVMRFAESCVSGRLPNGALSATVAIPVVFFNSIFNEFNSLPGGLPRVTPTSKDLRNPMQRIFECIGSYTNLSPFVLADRLLNIIKGALMGLSVPLSLKTFEDKVLDGLNDPDTFKTWMQYIQRTIAMFSYFQDSDVQEHLLNVAGGIGGQLEIIEQNTVGGAGLAAKWDEFFPIHMAMVQRISRTYVVELIQKAMYLVDATHPTNYAELMTTLQDLLGQVDKIWIPDYPIAQANT